jgi:hypothetical protein
MKKYAAYDEKEVREKIDNIYEELDNILCDFAMLSQQLDGERTNLDSNYIKGTVMPKINNIIDTLNDFGLGNKKQLDINQKREGLLKLMKEDLY